MYSREHVQSGRRRSGVRDDAVRDRSVRDDVELLGGIVALGAAATALRVVTRRRTARGKLRALVEALNVLSEELGGAPAAEELLAALSETLAAAQIATPHAEAAFVHAFCRDRSLLLGVEGYALTSLEVALATPPPRPGDVVPQVPAPPPAAAVAA